MMKCLYLALTNSLYGVVALIRVFLCFHLRKQEKLSTSKENGGGGIIGEKPAALTN